jgi:hypothetical protein
MWPPEAKSNPLVVADPPEAQTLTPAATKQAFHSLTRHPAFYILTHHVNLILIGYFVLVINFRAVGSTPTNHGDGHIGINNVKN